MGILRIPRRYLLLVVIATALLISFVGMTATRRARATTPADCAGDCRDNRDKQLAKCDDLPEQVRTKCKERANTQYDKCVERCNGE
jgi:hypothetical protein